MPPNYEAKYRAAYKKNVKDVQQDAHVGKLNKKIDNFCKLHGFRRSELIQKIKDEPIIAVCFAINPKKQNIYAKTAASYIEKIVGVDNFEHLPKNKRVSGDVDDAKRDFTWEYANYKFCASHKYTEDAGGAQRNAYKVLKGSIDAAVKMKRTDTYFIAIADGLFYQQPDSPEGADTRLEVLMNLAAAGHYVHACTIDELEELMKKITKE